MDEHFRAFTFVNRIVSAEVGKRVSASFRVPPSVTEFPLSLVGEAVGQSAAWSAMAALDFKYRPVAGIAAKIELLDLVKPGDELKLSADLDSVDAEAVSYSGEARVNGQPVIRLEHCVGPMLPMEEFDDPAAVRERFGFLCHVGTEENAFKGVPVVVPQRIAGEHAQYIRAAIPVPESAPFFADHFPRRPVFPGTLLMHANLQLAAQLVSELAAVGGKAAWRIGSVQDVKLRSFTPPGEQLESEVRVLNWPDGRPVIALETRKGKRLVGSGRVNLVPEVKS